MSTPRELANAIRALAMDAVQRANSGHPGMPMGMADIAEVLWRHYLRYNPANPQWPDRDRFVLSNGHGSMLLYAVLYLTGYALTLEDLQKFRQLNSRTPGHPEHDPPAGIETTTGPLGQGIANGVGMALAERLLAAEFNRPGHDIIDHYTYVFCGDGCLMEGVSHEACSLAGTLGLGKLILLYDDNGISIDGKVQGWFTDDTPRRFEAYGWHVVPNVDGLDAAAVDAALRAARAERTRPSLICCKTVIGFGAPHKEGTKDAHGEALGVDEVAAARETLGWRYPPFVVPEEIKQAWDHRAAGAQLEGEWRTAFARYAQEFPAQARELERRQRGDLPDDWPAIAQRVLDAARAQSAAQATRQSSQAALNVLGSALDR
ncbi:MAG: transketolase, partial [Gammaproteobacteria bacterium]|nr:transketolase [Gammaproteobacteria bacterium]